MQREMDNEEKEKKENVTDEKKSRFELGRFSLDSVVSTSISSTTDNVSY